MSENLPSVKTESALASAVPMPAGLDGATATDFLMPRYKIWHPMAKTEVMNAKLGVFYETTSAAVEGTTLRFHLLSQKNRSFTQDDGKVKNSKYMLIVKEGQYDLPAELILSGSGIRASAALNTALHVKSLADKNPNVFGYVIEATLEIKENEKGKFAVPKFAIVGSADGETFDKVVALHAQHAAQYLVVQGVDTATKYDETDIPV